jgi:hypothetical protein
MPARLRPLHLGRADLVVRGLGVVTAALLGIDAYVHFHDAKLYDAATGGSITEGSLFRVQAAVAVVVGLVLLVRPHWLVFFLAVLVAGAAAGAVYLYTYVDVGRLGPLPDMYEPTWALPGKRLSAGAEIAAAGTALVGTAVTLFRRRRPRRVLADSAGAARPPSAPLPRS